MKHVSRHIDRQTNGQMHPQTSIIHTVHQKILLQTSRWGAAQCSAVWLTVDGESWYTVKCSAEMGYIQQYSTLSHKPHCPTHSYDFCSSKSIVSRAGWTWRYAHTEIDRGSPWDGSWDIWGTKLTVPPAQELGMELAHVLSIIRLWNPIWLLECICFSFSLASVTSGSLCTSWALRIASLRSIRMIPQAVTAAQWLSK